MHNPGCVMYKYIYIHYIDVFRGGGRICIPAARCKNTALKLLMDFPCLQCAMPVSSVYIWEVLARVATRDRSAPTYVFLRNLAIARDRYVNHQPMRIIYAVLVPLSGRKIYDTRYFNRYPCFFNDLRNSKRLERFVRSLRLILLSSLTEFKK